MRFIVDPGQCKRWVKLKYKKKATPAKIVFVLNITQHVLNETNNAYPMGWNEWCDAKLAKLFQGY